MKIVIFVRESGVFDDNDDSFIELILYASLHEDVRSQIFCPICGKKGFSILSSVDSLKIKKMSMSQFFIDTNKKEQFFKKIKIRVEKILRNLPSCVIKNEPTYEHKEYIRNLFSFYPNFKLKEYYFE